MYVCMYACMYVCMYACMYACTHVCMYLCIYKYIDITNSSKLSVLTPPFYHEKIPFRTQNGLRVFFQVKVKQFPMMNSCLTWNSCCGLWILHQLVTLGNTIQHCDILCDHNWIYSIYQLVRLILQPSTVWMAGSFLSIYWRLWRVYKLYQL